MKAVILAGGKGTRLAPYTNILPKPLMPIGDMPIMELLLWQMQRAGVDDVILTVTNQFKYIPNDVGSSFTEDKSIRIL